ncbi:LPS-assembly lipoprotein LptE [Alteromonas sp. ASW11-130]|uniref:LPS-assembly lipoprotein LptE n=1 Tax=Alteromonas sp. ASW11-130 TaxID=3015775 RepID=UPI002241FE5C|nr:LPS assembly lipoprotein LptE [Alteromonas sp. ASW11-130]MCW8092104.1 LPS assembly lipoprotein LptE [Alteromonas sp. ASW11-130]
MSFSRFLLIMCLSSVLVACGFKLRGDHSLPAGYKHLHVESMHSHAPLKRALNKRLEIYNIVPVVDMAKESHVHTITITLAPEKLERRLLSVFSTGQVAEYELILGVPYTVKFGDNDLIEAYFEVVRDYQDDPDQVLAKSRELELVLSEMRREAADRIIRRLSSQSTTRI